VVCHDQRRARRNEALIAGKRPREEEHQLSAVIIDMAPDAKELLALRWARPAARDALRLRRGSSVGHGNGSILI
jgi:hypothetical protein